jgi:hypothetical protein
LGIAFWIVCAEINKRFMDDYYVLWFLMEFDFFNISGSLFVETNTDQKNRSSTRFVLMMTNMVLAGFWEVLLRMGY